MSLDLSSYEPTNNTTAQAPAITNAFVAIQNFVNALPVANLAGYPASSAKVLLGDGTWAALPVANIAGYPTDATKFLRGDGTWAAPGKPTGWITGIVTAAGAVSAGTGFSVVHTGTGVYTVTFTSSFAAIPTVVVTPSNNAADNIFAVAFSVSTSTLVVHVLNTSATAVDEVFSFIAAVTA